MDNMKIEQMSKNFISQTKCDYIEELLQAVFIVHTKILSVIQSHKSTTKSELKIPTIEDFVFKAFINCGREIWKYAYLFKEEKNSCDYQRNNNMIESKIEEFIVITIEDMLPVRDMLIEHVRDYTEESDDEEDKKEEDDDEDITDKSKFKLKKRQKGGLGLGYHMLPANSMDEMCKNNTFGGNFNLPDTAPPQISTSDTFSEPNTTSNLAPFTYSNEQSPAAPVGDVAPNPLLPNSTPQTPIVPLPPVIPMPPIPKITPETPLHEGAVKEIDLGKLPATTQIGGNNDENKSVSWGALPPMSGGSLDDLSAIDLNDLN
jgi:hypothetical protein